MHRRSDWKVSTSGNYCPHPASDHPDNGPPSLTRKTHTGERVLVSPIRAGGWTAPAPRSKGLPAPTQEGRNDTDDQETAPAGLGPHASQSEGCPCPALRAPVTPTVLMHWPTSSALCGRLSPSVSPSTGPPAHPQLHRTCCPMIHGRMCSPTPPCFPPGFPEQGGQDSVFSGSLPPAGGKARFWWSRSSAAPAPDPLPGAAGVAEGRATLVLKNTPLHWGGFQKSLRWRLARRGFPGSVWGTPPKRELAKRDGPREQLPCPWVLCTEQTAQLAAQGYHGHTASEALRHLLKASPQGPCAFSSGRKGRQRVPGSGWGGPPRAAAPRGWGVGAAAKGLRVLQASCPRSPQPVSIMDAHRWGAPPGQTGLLEAARRPSSATRGTPVTAGWTCSRSPALSPRQLPTWPGLWSGSNVVRGVSSSRQTQREPGIRGPETGTLRSGAHLPDALRHVTTPAHREHKGGDHGRGVSVQPQQASCAEWPSPAPRGLSHPRLVSPPQARCPPAVPSNGPCPALTLLATTKGSQEQGPRLAYIWPWASHVRSVPSSKPKQA